jgi:hypothetical protein
MDEGCASVIGILIVVALVLAFIVYVVLPLSIFLLVGLTAVGSVSGAGVAAKNFGEILVEAHKTVP